MLDPHDFWSAVHALMRAGGIGACSMTREWWRVAAKVAGAAKMRYRHVDHLMPGFATRMITRRPADGLMAEQTRKSGSSENVDCLDR
jgi:hypothetical protein